MQHLTLEALARLVDEPPLADEAAHVSSCLVCRRELEAMREQTAALAALPDPEPAAGAWAALEAELRREGLIVDVPRARTTPLWRRPALLRAAAALALFVTGGAAGVMLRGHSSAGPAVATEPTLGPPIAARPPAMHGDGRLVATPSVETGGEGPYVVEEIPAPAAVNSGVRMASTGAAARAQRPAERGVRRAQAELEQAEAAYLAALQRYAAIADPDSGADPGTRMAALDRMITTTRAALERAPGDPVINGYHLAALRERDALRRQLASAEKDWF